MKSAKRRKSEAAPTKQVGQGVPHRLTARGNPCRMAVNWPSRRSPRSGKSTTTNVDVSAFSGPPPPKKKGEGGEPKGKPSSFFVFFGGESPKRHTHRANKSLPSNRFLGVRLAKWLGLGSEEVFPSKLMFGCGSKLESQGYACFSLGFHLPSCHFGTVF